MCTLCVVKVREYRAGDEEGIAELFETRSSRRNLLDAWSWRYVDAPGAFDAPAVFVAEQERICGYGSLVRGDLIVAGEKYPAGQIGTGALGRSSGDLDVDSEIIDALVRRARDEGLAYVYIAATERAQPFFESLDFDFVCELNARNLYIGLEGLSSRLSRRAVSPFRKLAKEARRIRTKITTVPIDDAILATLGRAMAAPEERVELGIDKSIEQLTWRYKDDPRFDYELWVYRKNAGQGIDACAFVRRYKSETGRTIVHVDEQWTRQSGRRAQAKLFTELAMLGLTEEVDVVRCFAPGGTAREQALLGIGCIRKKVERVLLVQRLDESAPELEAPFEAKEIHISAGDLELYDP